MRNGKPLFSVIYGKLSAPDRNHEFRFAELFINHDESTRNRRSGRPSLQGVTSLLSPGCGVIVGAGDGAQRAVEDHLFSALAESDERRAR